ncbi:MAG TPA: hypothetical protein VF292_06320 [Rhodanobacteraceae bacterium]
MQIHRIAIVALVALAGAAFSTVPAQADPPPWAPAHGWRAHHQYVYYPSAEVYYAPDTRMWFWLGGNGWQAGVSLPAALQGYVQVGGVNISLDVDRPYLHNMDVVRRYGGHERRWWRGENDQGQDQGGHYRYQRDHHPRGRARRHRDGNGNSDDQGGGR